jgi:copper(I)-binding protein
VPLEETLVVILTGVDGSPITDATVALEGNMNHAGMIPVLADPIADAADGTADGRYHLPFTFTMLGDWIITVTVTQADGTTFSRNLDVRAGSEGIEGEAVMPMEAESSSTGSGDLGHDENGESEESTAGALTIHGPMARPAPLAGGTGAVYFMLDNEGSNAVTLIGAETPAAGATEIHTTTNDNGVMRMRQITDGVEIAPGEAIELLPGAMHLMLIDLAAPLAVGDTISVTLHFAGADDLSFAVPVVNMDELPAEAEHDHE